MNLNDMEKKMLQEQKEAAEQLLLIDFLKSFDPDIVNQKKSRYSKNVWISKLVNKQASNLDYYYGCGCCSDSDYNVRPVMKLNFNGKEIEVYGTRVYLGDKDYSHYLCNFRDADELLKDLQAADFNQILIDKVMKTRESHLKKLETINDTVAETYE